MAESRRIESLPVEPADRDSRAEALLVEGLDQYFSGRYDDAIHLWTRVLFLDRAQARARAYIDRARTAAAERQRQTEELLHRAGELLAGGQTARVRALLAEAVASGGDDERAAELRLRLERVERVEGFGGVGAHPRISAAVVDAVPVRGRVPSFISARTGLVALAAMLIASALASPSVRDWFGFGASTPSLAAVGPRLLLPMPTSAEASLVRARTLYAHGRLAEALAALDRVDPDSAQRGAADTLRVEIQQVLLAIGRNLTPGAERPEVGQP